MTRRPLARVFCMARMLRISILLLLFFVSSAEAQAQEKQQAPSCTAQGYLRVAVYSAGKDVRAPVAIVLADPEGRRVGFDPLRKTEYSDVPQATYVGGHETVEPVVDGIPAKPVSSEQYVEICHPTGGQYQLRLIGIKQGAYTMSVSAASREFLDSSDKPMSLDSRAEIPAATTRKGAVQSFLVVYSRTPGVKVRVKPAPQK
ncbi:MAG: hypothetical protein JWO13_3384 [Acidobacteriales bacterium]|nr:hypothetical protein [Terriglobales bacterium]